jgi:hypothetical protein
MNEAMRAQERAFMKHAANGAFLKEAFERVSSMWCAALSNATEQIGVSRTLRTAGAEFGVGAHFD